MRSVPPNHRYLALVTQHGDTFWRFPVEQSMLDTPEMRELRAVAHDRGFSLEMYRLDTVEDVVRFLRLVAPPEGSDDAR